MDGLGFDQVVVIEDEDNPVGDGSDLVDQRGQDDLDRRWLRGLERAQHAFFDIGLNRLQGGDEVGQEADRVVVTLIQREPGSANRWFDSLATGYPLAGQRRLAETGIRRSPNAMDGREL